jgi:hypothetical protein
VINSINFRNLSQPLWAFLKEAGGRADVESRNHELGLSCEDAKTPDLARKRAPLVVKGVFVERWLADADRAGIRSR